MGIGQPASVIRLVQLHRSRAIGHDAMRIDRSNKTGKIQLEAIQSVGIFLEAGPEVKGEGRGTISAIYPTLRSTSTPGQSISTSQ